MKTGKQMAAEAIEKYGLATATRRGEEAFVIARSWIQQRQRGFYSTVLSMLPRSAPMTGSLFLTDRLVLGVNYAWMGEEVLEKAAGSLIHASLHVLRDLNRITSLPNQEIAWRAFDLPINDDMRRAGIPLPDWALYSSDYGLPQGLTGEEYYKAITRDVDRYMKKFPDLQIGAGGCGTCEGMGLDLPPGSLEEFLGDDPGRTAPEIRYLKAQGKQEFRTFMEGRYGRGNQPGLFRDMLYLTGDNEPAVIPWLSVLGSRMSRYLGRTRAGYAAYSLQRPSKRSLAIGEIRPGFIDHEPIIVYIEDWSGSMGHHQLEANRAEAANLMRRLGITHVYFIGSDTAVQMEPHLVTIQELKQLPALGRGGTDFRPAIELACKIRPRPNLIIYSTDGDGWAPKEKPAHIDFIWLLAPGGWTRSPCNWGTQILTSDDPKVRKKYEIWQTAA